MNFILVFLISLLAGQQIFANSATTNYSENDMKKLEAMMNTYMSGKWYNKMNISGYTQFRYNRFFESNPDLKCNQCDKSLGDNNNFFIRRGRIIFQGDLDDRIFFYIQPDFASTASDGNNNFFQIRDAYFDLSIDCFR